MTMTMSNVQIKSDGTGRGTTVDGFAWERFVVAGLGGLNYIGHLDGVSWTDARPPRRWHFCWPQTIGYLNHTVIHRCACGAMRLGWVRWTRRNQRQLVDSEGTRCRRPRRA